jgi:aspartyl-tRNA(Asn)/glutamyl-tRNA(Gln) amidotransferase subunit A
MSAAALAARVRDGASLARASVDSAFARADDVVAGPDGLNITLWEDREYARAEADALDARAERSTGALAGVPVMVKDNLATLHLPTTCASRMLAGYVSPFEATAVARLRAAGAIVIGKTNMDEFAMGSSTEHSAYGATRNPHDRTRVPGGSSGGSAAAVAAGIVPIALGSETGGSVRQPAAFCGVVGIKPTYGRVSRYGLVAFASSLDHVGAFGRTVDDAALALQVIAGHDPRDATSVERAVPRYRRAAAFPLRGVVIGRPREYFPDGLHSGIRAQCDEALEKLRELGAEVRDVSLPHTEVAIPVYYIIAPAESSANLSRFDGVRYGMRAEGASVRAMYENTRSLGFGDEVVRRILLGTYVLSAGYYEAFYKRAMDVRAVIRTDVARVFASGVHLLFTPTTPTAAFPLGAITDPYEMYLSDIFTVTANLTGIPAMSIPIGQVDGLPVGGQFMAPPFDEERMLAVAGVLERALGAGAGA